jgi:outer membrane protein assembly factor BamB
MGTVVRPALIIAAIAIGALYLAPPAVSAKFVIRFPFFHHAQHNWTQFRMGPDNNPVVPGNLQTSWHVDTHANISASPTLVDGTLYLGNNRGRLYAIDASNGRVLWTFTGNNPFMSAPLVYGSLVIVGEGNADSMETTPSEPGEVGQGSSALIAVARTTGKLRWKTRLGGSGMPTPAIIDGVLVDHNGAGWVAGYDPRTGRKKFQHHLDSVASMSAILPLGGDDFATTGVGTNAIWKMSARDGSVVWSSRFPNGASGIGDCPPVSDGTRIFCDYVVPAAPNQATEVGADAIQRAYAVDAATGAKVWDVSLERGTLPPRNEAAIPLLVGNVVYLGSSIAPVMHALDTVTGQLVWSLRTHGPVKGGAVAVDGTIYFGDLGGYLWAVNANDGRVVGDMKTATPFNVGSPIVDGKTLIVGSDTGVVTAVPLQTIADHHDS